jgi:hypothetical protein
MKRDEILKALAQMDRGQDFVAVPREMFLEILSCLNNKVSSFDNLPALYAEKVQELSQLLDLILIETGSKPGPSEAENPDEASNA